MVREGDTIPDIVLNDQDDKAVKLRDLIGKGWLVIYFYPRDGTPGCTAQACSFRDQYEEFTEAGAMVVGISSDKTSTHRSFSSHHNLPFTLLSDEKGEARNSFSVPRDLGILPGRVTYIVDRAGIVRMVFRSQMRATEHVDRALEFIKTASS